MKMYQKRVTKRKQQDSINPPEFQYMNIYKKNVNRLDCFRDICEDCSESEDDQMFHGDATAYENYLEYQIKKMVSIENAQPMPLPYFNSENYQGGYQTNFQLNTLPFKPGQSLESLTLSLASQVF